MRTFALLFVLLSGGAALAQAPDLNATYKNIDELYKRRDEPQAAQEMEQKIAEILKAAPEDPEALWRAARWDFWKADTTSDTNVKENLSKAGWDLAEKAIAKNPESKDARYWATVNCGDYGDGMGIINALAKGLEGKFRRNLDWIVAKDPQYDNWGPLITEGRYYAKLPWPKRDREKAAKLYADVLQKQPQNLRAREFWAEMLMEQGGKANYQAALKLVNEIIAAPGNSYDPPEERFIQKQAKALKPKIEEELK